MRLLGMREVDLISFSPRSGRVGRASLAGRSPLWLKDRDWAADGGTARRTGCGRRMEDVARAADVVVGVSDTLVADCLALGVASPANPQRMRRRRTTAGPVASRTTLAPLGRPRVVFSGAWNWRVDMDLVAAAAASSCPS